MTFDLVIRGGTIVTDDATFVGDIGIRDGTLAAVGGSGLPGESARAIDARGLLVLPGLVDPHVHLAHKVFMNGEWVRAADDIAEGTRAAALGGCTTVIDFAVQRDQDPVATVAARRAEADPAAVIDYALHAVLTVNDPKTADEIPALVAGGVSSFKLYMTYRKQGRMADDALLFNALRRAEPVGALVGVHAENAAIAESNTDALVGLGRTTAKDFAAAKPDHVEAEAINRALFLAEEAGAGLYIFHLSTRRGLDLVRRARARGVRVFAETCTHYLTLTDAVYEGPDGHRFICSPPLRGSADLEALWGGIADGAIEVVSSDHCGFGAAAKDRRRDDFTQVPNGLPGVDLRLPMLYTYGHRAGRLTLAQLARLLSTGPARIFGLAPRKGTIAPGSDADLTLVDPSTSRSVAPREGGPDWSPYVGRTLYGWPAMTIARGEIVAEAGRVTASPGRGRFLSRVPARS